ncbi:hypothetical protein SAMN04488063_0921 [Halopelagius inordinatus]|uniref:Uncharacterized protein n=1 Tax=Halopelagius inordinatus TaxID=553467 RepID=A0A1I2N2F6_9EURY|nr:hypothetical protein [Halopelagius inordinatus]SFF95716.1 hypothetical protein SAMN04488063_0921 [Halopelagius inordinatus]
MTETHAPGGIRNALSRLADGTAPRREAAYETTIDEAADCVSSARDAAAFVAAGGEGRLARAVADADAAGDERAAERGRRTLAALRRLRSAARGENVGGAADQFHSGHGTVLPGAGQPRDR